MNTFVQNRKSAIVRSLKKPLALALTAAALSLAAAPSFAADWWTTMPATVTGATTINVRTMGALGDGVHDDTAAFQAAVNALPADGGTVYAGAGHYMINALKPIQMRSHTRLLMAGSATLEVIPNSASRYWLIKVWNVNNVRIVGGNLVGDRVKHMGTTGEWGYGINVSGSQNVVVKQVKLSNFWGDGILIGAITTSRSQVLSDYVTVTGVTSSNNRRQGITIAPSKHVYIVGNTFKNSIGTLPESGMDIEPQTEGPVSAVRVENNVFSGNNGNGIELHSNISDITFANNTLTGNRGFGALAINSNYLTFIGNNANNNGLAGIGVSGTTNNVSITGNTLKANSTRFVSPTNTKSALNRDLQLGATTYAISVSGNFYSNPNLDTYAQ
ncbi:MAG TPA: right-handed parallel beta-helix repeat-containing protein [Frateuria sp.]|uniref:right-handed parallel beta-helix repeat-containing protein n=1 Tax=Frateuria sp. TaxID=2211372 RepID=UPI002DF3BDC4|nr:right-handed parallel beta-helix repeat-containing protein [Frateuria sp.]